MLTPSYDISHSYTQSPKKMPCSALIEVFVPQCIMVVINVGFFLAFCKRLNKNIFAINLEMENTQTFLL